MRSISIYIDAEGIRFLLENQQTIIMVVPPSEGEDNVVACASLYPFTEIKVEFGDLVYLYASKQVLTLWETIKIQDSQPANLGWVYTLNNTGFGSSRKAFSNEVIGLFNNRFIGFGANTTCGFAQEVGVNEGKMLKPISVSSVPYNETAYNETTSKIWVFVARGIQQAMVLPVSLFEQGTDGQGNITVGNYLEVDLSTNPSVYFNNMTHAFQMKGN